MASAQKKGRVDQVIETLATGLGNSVGWLAEHGVLFGIFALLWIGFGAALIWSQGSLDQAWATIRGLPLIIQGVVWLLLLPIVGGLWVWETTWPLVVRLVVVAGLAFWNLLVLMPKAMPSLRS